MYLLFGGEDYEACGGARDLYGSYDTEDLAMVAVDELELKHGEHGGGVWWHIYSVLEDDVVAESK